MSKKIWCVMSSDDGESGNNVVSMGCYTTEEEAEKALEYFDENEYYHWIEVMYLFAEFKEPM